MKRLDIDMALNLLGVEPGCSLVQLKVAYRSLIKKWHPDLNLHRLQKATEQTQLINQAYDLLEGCVGYTKQARKQWSDFQVQMEPKWRKEFQQSWMLAYQKACADSTPYGGMHLHSTIEYCRRSRISPPDEWFRGALFKDTPEQRSHYQEWLLKKAPNQKLKEEWARKYFALEFGSGWVFYLPARKELLTA